MDFKGLKDQLNEKTKDELLQKVDEIKTDITKKFGSSETDKISDNDSGPPSISVAHIEQPGIPVVSTPLAETEETEIEGQDVESAEDSDKESEEAA